MSETNPIHFAAIERFHPEVLAPFEGKQVLSFRERVLKPSAKLYLRALEESGCDNFEDCLYVDDILDNVIAAQQFGMQGHHYVGLYGFVMLLREKGLLQAK